MVSLFSFSQFSCEKLKRVAPSEAVPGFSDGVTTRYHNFYISLFFPKYLLLLINATRKKIKHVQPTSLLYDTMATMALRPPSPKSCRNTTRTRGVAAKRILTNSWGQYASFRRSSDEKSTSHHFKNSPFVPGRAEPMNMGALSQ
jgi:hypothetical protein